MAKLRKCLEKLKGTDRFPVTTIIENDGVVDDEMEKMISENSTDIENKFNNYERYTFLVFSA